MYKEKANDVTRSCVVKVGGRNTLSLMEEFVFFWNIFKTKRFTKKLKMMKFIALVISYIMENNLRIFLNKKLGVPFTQLKTSSFNGK